MAALDHVDTIVVVILENRSFDHMLGYLSLPRGLGQPPTLAVRGLVDTLDWRNDHANYYPATPPRTPYTVTRLDPKIQKIVDPRHNRIAIDLQINTPPADPELKIMGGFVLSYQDKNKDDNKPTNRQLVMGYYDQEALPTFDFFARNFAVCDHWFAPLPCGTHPNKFMAMAGATPLLDNADLALPDFDLVYDWLTKKKVTWAVYQSGGYFPFFTLMPRMFSKIFLSLTLPAKDHRGPFRRFKYFEDHWKDDTKAMPSVIFMEPEYSSGPRKTPNDDHAPTGVARGQAFLADIYTKLIANPRRWARTVMIVTYDEHGGFYDHEPPLQIETVVNGNKTVSTSGVRVPALVISPLVAPGSVFPGDLDHTSIIQLLVDKFSPNEGYSEDMNKRQKKLQRLVNLLRDPPAVMAPPIPIPNVEAILAAGKKGYIAPTSGTALTDASNDQAMHRLALKARDEHGELFDSPAWKDLKAYVEANPDPPA